MALEKKAGQEQVRKVLLESAFRAKGQEQIIAEGQMQIIPRPQGMETFLGGQEQVNQSGQIPQSPFHWGQPQPILSPQKQKAGTVQQQQPEGIPPKPELPPIVEP